jgi:RNA polymerase sigma factor (sigma-70 family)
MSRQNFNPFTTRQRVTTVKWYEKELKSFYDFVEQQQRLTKEDELKYGRATKIGLQLEQFREAFSMQLEENKNLEDSSAMRLASDEELAEQMGISIRGVERIRREGHEGRNRLINSNLKLVLAVVSRYRSSSSSFMSNKELITVGVNGLAKAAERYDYTKGFRFATYATWYIHQAISSYARSRRHLAKIPSKYILLNRKVKQFVTDYNIQQLKPPSKREIAIEFNTTVKEINKIFEMSVYPTSTSLPLTNTKTSNPSNRFSGTYEDLLKSDISSPLEISHDSEAVTDFEYILQNNLNDVERDVIRFRYGLDDGKKKPIGDVGKRFKISWKEVRDVEKGALTKLVDTKEVETFAESYVQ